MTTQRTVLYGHRPGERLDQFLLLGAELTPQRPAVVERDRSGSVRVHSYSELARQAASYARELDLLGLDICDRVILQSDTSACAIAMLAACSSLGLTFIPVSPEAPRQRVSTIIETSGAMLHLRADSGVQELAAPLPAGAGAGWFDASGLVIERPPRPGRRRRRGPTVTDPAYIIFTSGTTGRPKGVVMSHRAVVSFYLGMLTQEIVTAEDRVATTSPLQFDFSLLDIGLALGSGAAVVPVPPAVVRLPRRLLGLLQEAEVTQVNGVPSIWRAVLRYEVSRLAGISRIRGVLYCGEPFPVPELLALQRALPDARIVNCYGATESMACSFADVPNPLPADAERVSIGCAHPGAEMLLFDEAGSPIDSAGAVGEIYVRSPALFDSYWDDPDATRRALVPDPLNRRSGQLVLRSGDLGVRGPGGDLYYVGRADLQVKVRGNRVELPEVEGRLLEHPWVSGAAVVLDTTPTGDSWLRAFAVLSSPPEAPGTTDEETAAELLAFCRAGLPSYMVPEMVTFLDELPLTPHGKLDRTALVSQTPERQAAPSG